MGSFWNVENAVCYLCWSLEENRRLLEEKRRRRKMKRMAGEEL